MSLTSSPVSVASALALKESDSRPSLSAKLTPTPVPSSKSIGPMSPTSETSQPCNLELFPKQTYGAGGSPVSHSAWPVLEGVPRIGGIFGRVLPDSLAKLGHDGSFLKTSQGYCQLTLEGSLEGFSETWPRAGMLLNGTVFLLRPLVLLTGETDCGLLPTPTVGDSKNAANKTAQRKNPNSKHHDGTTLVDAVRMGGRGMLNPRWVEWLMNFPDEWTALDASETPLSRRSRSG